MSLSKAEKGFQLEVAATWGNRPIEELNKLISRRVSEMGELSERAIIGTAIATCRSLRAQTAVAKLSASEIAPFTVENTNLYGAWRQEKDAKHPVRCFRRGPRQIDPSVRLENGKFPYGRGALAVYWKVAPNTPQEQCHVYIVKAQATELADEKHHEMFMVVATNKGVCKKVVEQRRLKRIGKYRYLARNALTVAMQKASKGHPAALSGSGKAKEVAKLMAQAEVYRLGSGWAVEIRDNLEYAALAVKGGQAGVNLALAKAANKIAGNIIHHYHKQDKFLDPSVKVPFPEILARGA